MGINLKRLNFEKTEDRAETPETYRNDEYIRGARLWLIQSGIITAALLPAIDQSIVSTAAPQIVSRFNSLNDISWVVSAYFCA